MPKPVHCWLPLLSLLAVSTGCGANRLVTGGQATWNDDVHVTGGSLFVEQGRPAVLFGTVTPAGSPRGLTYLFVIRHEFEESAANTGELRLEGSGIEELRSVLIGDASLALRYRVDVPAARRVVEALHIGGTPVDLAKGRVFLADFTTPAASWRQLEVDCSVAPPDGSSTEEVEEFALRATGELRRRSTDVDRFLR